MNLQAAAPWLGAILIILAISLTVLVVLQSKGNDMSSFLGGEASSSFRTKRGLESTMHTITIYGSVLFFIVTFFAFIAFGQAG